MASKASSSDAGSEKPVVPSVIPDRNTFEDQYPVMFQFYKERGKLSEEQHTKVQEIQSRWKAGLVFWLTSDNKVIEIPDWVAMNVVINNKTNIFRSSRICMSLNHTKGYGCNRLADGTCSYIHECVLCGQSDHGVFQKRPNGTLICKRLRKWNEEEERYKSKHGETTSLEDKLSDMANRPRDPPGTRTRTGSNASGPDGAASPQSQPAARPTRTPEQVQKVKTLSGTTGCTEQQAFDLLVANRWNIQLAADAFFELGPADEITPASSAGGAAWGNVWAQATSPHSISRQQSEQQPTPQQASQTPKQPSTPVVGPTGKASAQPGPQRAAAEAAAAEELAPGALDLGPPWEESTPSPPPVQPPPPRMPTNWQALWSEQHQAYYFWHIPTSKTQWEVPPLDTASDSANAPVGSRPGTSTGVSSRAVGEAVSKQPAQRTDSSFSTASAALSGLPGLAAGIGPLCGSLGQLQLGTSGVAVSATDREQRSPVAAPQALESRSVAERGPPDRFMQPPAERSFKERAEAERKGEELWSCREGHYMCTQHWWPPEGVDTCMRLFHGEHVMVTYTDGKESGWAYGHIIDNSSHEGYFPQAVLKEVKRPPRRRGVGEACSVAERFEAPPGVAGYLTVAPGDVLKVLHPMEAPCVWIYVQLMTVAGPEEGWVPEAVLNNAHPAG